MTPATDRPPSRRPPGRPRSAGADAAIVEAALRLLASEGYTGMTVDAVAAEAGVGKATIYLRYRGKEDLATAALAHLRETGEAPVSDDPRADLVGLMRLMRVNAERHSVMTLVGTCLTEEQRTPELLRLFRERSLVPRRRAVGAILERARDAGLLDPGVRLDAVVDLLMGAFHARYLAGGPVPAEWEEDLVDAVLRSPGGGSAV